MKHRRVSLAVLGNFVSFSLSLVCPVLWGAPLSAAFMTAAGAAGGEVINVVPGLILASAIGRGGLGAFFSGALGWLGAEMYIRRGGNRMANCSLWAFVCAVVPTVSRHLHGGGYMLLCAFLTSLIALPAAPVFLPALKRECLLGGETAREEKIALHVIACASIAGLCRLRAEIGIFASALFALILSGGGAPCGALGAFTAGMGLLLGDLDSVAVVALFVGAGASGLAREGGAWAQAGAFLAGLPIAAYLGWNPAYAFFAGAAALFPWISTPFLRAARRPFLPKELVFAPRFRMEAARRHLPARGESVCGDSGGIEKLPDARMLLLLADGMGTGAPARRASDRAVAETKLFSRARLSSPEILRAVNRLSAGEDGRFSTLDACEADLTTGILTFHKCGSEPSWILTQNGVKRVCGASLPLGALNDIKPAVRRARLKENEAVFMATDGLVLALGGEEGTQALLFGLRALPPAEICARALSEARKRGYRDDVSVLCARLRKRADATAEAAEIAEEKKAS